MAKKKTVKDEVNEETNEETTITVGSFAAPIEASIAGLEAEILELEAKLHGVDEIYAQLRMKKKQSSVLARTMTQLSGAPTSQNRPRGQNLIDIQGFLAENGEHTVRGISDETGINIPSIRYTLSGNEQFSKGPGNLWSTSA